MFFKQKFIITISCLFLFATSLYPNVKIRHSKDFPLTILYDKDDEKTVELAVLALADDFDLLTGIRPSIMTDVNAVGGDVIIVGSLDNSSFIKELENKNLLDTKDVSGKWEVYGFQFIEHAYDGIERALVIFGSDKRGTAYGVFDLSEKIGLSPWNWWADVKPEKKDFVEINFPGFVSSTPSVKYRGIFLNDECWGLNPWASDTWEPEESNIGPRTYAVIFELLLRLKANFIWPAMHPCTHAFYKNPDNPKVANDYGIVVGSSHAEPMLRNNVDEWDHDKYGEFNFFTNRETVLNYWEERVRESQDYESIYTLGMRGIHDSGMVGARSMQEQIAALQDIIMQQRSLLTTYVDADVRAVPQAFTAYKEVLDIYDAGLELPDDITLVWPDDNYGYIHRFSDTTIEKRQGGGGIYYHISYWGRPHDYLWLSSTHPVLIWEEMIKAAYFNSNEIWVVNVGDLKPLEYNISLFLDMAWDTGKFSNSTSVREHFKAWHVDIFGTEAGKEIAALMWKYYDLNFIRRPEFMGWSQTEPTRKIHPTEFNHFQAGDEAQKRIEAFDDLISQRSEIKNTLPSRLYDAWFQLVEYPLLGAAYLNKKFLYMEKAYYYAAQNRLLANDYALKSKAVYDSIQYITKYYNEEMGGGKWKGMMYMQPRDLPVFDMLPIPQWEFVTEAQWGIATEGDEDIRRINEIKGPLNLPTFYSFSPKEYFVDIFLKQNQILEWKAEPSADWIKLDSYSGTLNGNEGSKQQRIFVSLDWEKAPKRERLSGSIKFSGEGVTYSIQVNANNLEPEILDKHLFIEANGYISGFAANYNRAVNTDSFGWDIIDGLGYTGKCVWVNPLREKVLKYDPELQDPSVLEYDMYFTRGQEVELTIYTIPVHPINQNYSLRFGIAFDNEEPQIVDYRTFGRSEEWKLNVLRNNAIVKTKHRIPSAGHHCLKIYALDPGVIIDRITVDCGGLIKTYSTLDETKALKH